MTMTKTLMLAAVTALTLGAGAAQAQSLGPSSAEGAYYTGQSRVTPATRGNGTAQWQSGASDVPVQAPAIGHTLPFSPYEYGTLANPG
jgi:hypothetical protein